MKEKGKGLLRIRVMFIGGFVIWTFLVLCVMPTLIEQVNRRVEKKMIKKTVNVLVICFSVFMVLGRLISGVHWLTDIVGSIMLSTGLFSLLWSEL